MDENDKKSDNESEEENELRPKSPIRRSQILSQKDFSDFQESSEVKDQQRA